MPVAQRIGNVYFVTSEGSIVDRPLLVTGIGFWANDTTSKLVLTLAGTPIFDIRRDNLNTPAFQYFPIQTTLSTVSASVVTACSGWIYLKT